MAKVKIGDEEVVISEFSARKALRVTKIIRSISQGWPQIAESMTQFVRDYQAHNFVELDRASAQFQFGPRPLVNDNGDYERDDRGEVRYGPSRLAHMTDEDWERSGQKLKLPSSPSQLETVWHVLPLAFDLAEEQMMQLAALVIVSNQELKRAAREGGDAITELLRDRGEDLLDDANGDQLLELLVAASEVVEQQFATKIRELGERVGNLRKLFGLASRESETQTTSSSTQRPPSSTDSPAPTDGANRERSTGPAGDGSSRLATV